MPTGQGPTVTRRRLRAELRRLRLEKGLSVEHVANEIEWSNSKLIRIESGQVGISKADLMALLSIYGVADGGLTAELQELARATRQRTWWSQYQRYLPASYLEFIGSEADATRAVYFQPLIVPGLLQTREYAAEINRATTLVPGPPEVVNARTEVRQRRQQELLERQEALEAIFVLDEATLHRGVGGRTVMREQLDHLAATAERGNITMVVIPYRAGAHFGMAGPFIILEYADPQNDDVVYLESVGSGAVVRDQPEVVESYRRAAERLIGIGLQGDAAVDVITRVKHEFT